MGIFSEEMNIATVVPFFKYGDKHACTNYRPISLLPQFSTILENDLIVKHKSIRISFRYVNVSCISRFN